MGAPCCPPNGVMSRRRRRAFVRPLDGDKPLQMFRGVFGLVYLVIGIAVAASYEYLDRLTTVTRLLSAALAILLWPLVLLGISLHIR